MRYQSGIGLALFLAIALIVGTVSASGGSAFVQGPIAGAAISVETGDETVGATTTDSTGGYRVDSLEARSAYDVTSELPQFITTVIKGVDAAGGIVSELDIAMEYATGDILGSVFDSITSQPISNAVVTLYHGSEVLREVITHSDGSFLIDAVGVDTKLWLQVDAQNYISATKSAFPVGPGVRTHVSIALDPAQGSLTGIVSDKDTGEPLVGATVTVEISGHDPVSTVSDTDGRYLLESLPAAPTSVLTASNSGYVSLRQDGIAVSSGRVRPVDMPLAPLPGSSSGSGTIVVNIRDAVTGESIPASVVLYRHDTTYSYKSGSTGDGGQVTLTSVDANSGSAPYRIRVTSSGYTSLTYTGILVRVATTTVDVALWPASGVIPVTLVDGVTGLPVAGSLALYRHNTSYSYKSTSTSTDGIANFTSVEANAASQPYRIRATSSGYTSVDLTGFIVAGGHSNPRTISLWPSRGNLVISVRDAILDEPVSGSVALYRHATTFSYRSTSLDEYGIATFTLVDANDAGLPYYARVTSSGRTTITIDGIIVAGGLTTYRDLSMWPNRGTLEIISKDAVTNAPISGSISLYRHGTTYSYRSSAFGTDGIATLSLVDINSAAQPYRVALTSSGYETLTVDGLTISGAAKTSLPSRLWPSNGVISGVVTNSLGTPINASVALYRHNTSYSFRSTTAASDGSFSMTGVPANAFDEPYRLVFSRTGYSSATVSNVFVHSGTTTNIDAVCRTDTPTTTALSSPQPGAVAGVARDILTGAPLAGARVSLHRAGSAERQVFADTEGAFEFSDVLWGLGYSLHVESDGYVNYSISGLAVRGGRTTYLQPELAPVYGSIAGRLVASIPEAPGARHSISVSSSPQHAGAVQGSGVFTEGQVVTVVATPAAGYAFSGWTEDGELVSSNDSYVFTVTRPRTLVANFEPLSVVISTEVSPASSGSVSGAATYDYAATVTLVASATEPFVFHRWMEDGVQVSTDPVYSFTATHARHLVAWFRQFAQADLNQDGRVDLLDLVILAQKYRLTSQDAGWIPEYDLNGDGIIDIYDMAAVARAIEP